MCPLWDWQTAMEAVCSKADAGPVLGSVLWWLVSCYYSEAANQICHFKNVSKGYLCREVGPWSQSLMLKSWCYRCSVSCLIPGVFNCLCTSSVSAHVCFSQSIVTLVRALVLITACLAHSSAGTALSNSIWISCMNNVHLACARLSKSHM